MSKHEIRLRREMMTSRRIQSHKSYSRLMDRHKRSKRLRLIVVGVAALAALTLLIWMFIAAS